MTVILFTRLTEAEKMLEFLNATHYVRVIDEEIPDDETISAIKDVDKGKVKSYPLQSI